MNQHKTAELLRRLANEAERGDFTEVLVLTGRNGRMASGATASTPGTEFSHAAQAVMESCRATPCYEPPRKGRRPDPAMFFTRPN